MYGDLFARKQKSGSVGMLPERYGSVNADCRNGSNTARNERCPPTIFASCVRAPILWLNGTCTSDLRAVVLCHTDSGNRLSAGE